MRQLVLFPVRQDPNVIAEGIAKCRAALEKSSMSLQIPQARGTTIHP